MTQASDASGALILLFLLVQLATLIGVVVGCLYGLSCLKRTAAATERLTELAETWLHFQSAQHFAQTQNQPPAPPQHNEVVEVKAPTQTAPARPVPPSLPSDVPGYTATPPQNLSVSATEALSQA